MVTLLLVLAIITGFFIARGHPVPATEGCPYILVLGCKVVGNQPGTILKYRIAKACEYLTEHPETVAVLSGGKGDGEHISEAQCMRRELLALGISDGRLWLEEQSATTKENLQFSMEILRERAGNITQPIGILSSETHLFRACRYAKDLGVSSVGIPAKTCNLFYRVFYFLREIPCIWNQFLFGG